MRPISDMQARDALSAKIDQSIDNLKADAVKVLGLSDIGKFFDLTFITDPPGFYVDKVKKTQSRTSVDYDYLSAAKWTYHGYKGLESSDNKYKATLSPDPKGQAQSDGSGDWLCDLVIDSTKKTYKAKSDQSAHGAYSQAVIMARKDLGIKDPGDWTVNTPQTFDVLRKDQSAKIDGA